MKIKIRERSVFARAAARCLRCKRVAAVFGNTIHLWNVSRSDFLKSESWVMHELEHVRQFKKYGVLRFSILYLWEMARNGYEQNCFEVEARVAEMNVANFHGIHFL